MSTGGAPAQLHGQVLCQRRRSCSTRPPKRTLCCPDAARPPPSPACEPPRPHRRCQRAAVGGPVSAPPHVVVAPARCTTHCCYLAKLSNKVRPLPNHQRLKTHHTLGIWHRPLHYSKISWFNKQAAMQSALSSVFKAGPALGARSARTRTTAGELTTMQMLVKNPKDEGLQLTVKPHRPVSPRPYQPQGAARHSAGSAPAAVLGL